ncbi:MAG: aspartate aminotransferase family protein [Rhodospirillaceae bacterium]|jgi:4-aminobutyrate--pyruvate transaminase|nr:aspartate aminotransferase family protein [Rhodospirillaceae bacterium]MBT5666751.1 aspartate aminotransferase family protein [Rhodospirillaceae bacterium]MBT5811266.1 aspartate aminotransferase family protein [Rhodospirillaceae bacterium]
MTDRTNSPESRDIANVLHAYTNLEKHQETGPFIARGGKGIYIRDEAGKEYIEGLAGLWCTSLGFGEERLIEAATRQMRELPFYHVFSSKSHNPAIDLAERLIELVPVPMSKAFFANSGSEANDTVVKLVWYYNNAKGRPEKKKIFSRIRGYHGVTVAAASLTGLPANHMDFDLPIANIRHTDCPHYYEFCLDGETEEDFASRLAVSLEQQILDEGPETVAAFIAEPIMGAGGVIMPPRTYFEKIQVVLKKYDILFIADEVICGFGRTGNMFATETYDLKPDMMTMAKALSSAYLPISAVLINEEVFKTISANSNKVGVFGHGFTYSGHPVAAAVALETLKLYEERDIIGHVRSVTGRFQARVNAFMEHSLVGETRAIGLIGAVQLAKDKSSRTHFDPSEGVGPFIAARAQEHGLIVRALPNDTVAFCPPLIITETEIDDMFDRFEKALGDCNEMVQGRTGAAA